MYDGATYFAWFVLALLFCIAVGLIVWIGSLPGNIAHRRNHPQVDAINALSWFGLLLGGVGWVVAFVWALYRSAPLGTSASSAAAATGDTFSAKRVDGLAKETESLKARITDLERRLPEAPKTEN